MSDDKKKPKEAEELSLGDLEAAAALLEAIDKEVHYLRQEAATQEMFGHKSKYIN